MTERLYRLKTVWPWLLALASLSTLWAALLSGVGTDVHWPSVPVHGPSTPAVPPAPVVQAAVPLQVYAQVWTSPLFAEHRQADNANMAQESSQATPVLETLTMTGTVVAGEVRVALLKDAAGVPQTLKEGQSLPSGWTVTRITERQLELSHGSHTQTLELAMPRLPMTLP